MPNFFNIEYTGIPPNASTTLTLEMLQDAINAAMRIGSINENHIYDAINYGSQTIKIPGLPKKRAKNLPTDEI